MKISCLVNNFNYGRFVEGAVDSALAQTAPLDEIVVVDDGSTDDSVERLRRRYASDPRVHVVAKSNAGQLSCFQEGFARSSGDVVFFLDADDAWDAGYVAAALDVYSSRSDVDFVFCSVHRLGEAATLFRPWPVDRDLGYSVVMDCHRPRWIGSPTSAVSMRRSVLERLFPIPYLEDWRTRADDCLVHGAAVAGARKYYLERPLVGYRVHAENRWFGLPADAAREYRHSLAVNRLVRLVAERMGWRSEQLLDLAHLEFATIAAPTFGEWRRYARLTLRSRRSWVSRIRLTLRMARRCWGGGAAPSGAGPRR